MDAEFQSLVERAKALSSCHISDGMDRIGLPRAGLVGIRPLEPVGMAVGEAFTVSLKPVGEVDRFPGEYFDHLLPGQMVMLANDGRVHCSVWGGNRSLTTLKKGGVGAVADGAYRDVPEHRMLGLPVFGLQPTSMASVGVVIPYRVNERVIMRGVPVEPGDLVAGDASGVVVVPRARAAEVILAAEQLAASEVDLAEEIRQRAASK
jgi:4-hydroxy-4-methyl-2-oxoglutarate aldolase